MANAVRNLYDAFQPICNYLSCRDCPTYGKDCLLDMSIYMCDIDKRYGSICTKIGNYMRTHNCGQELTKNIMKKNKALLKHYGTLN